MARSREGGGTLRLVVIAASLLVLAVGGVFGVRWARTADVFAVDRIETWRYRYTQKAVIDSLLGARLGHNIWTCDVDSLSADITDLPWIREAPVMRRPPGTLTVALVEWEPRLRFRDRDGTRLLLLEDGRLVDQPDHVSEPDVPLYVGPGIPQREIRGLYLDLLDAVAETGLDELYGVEAVDEIRSGLVVVLADGAGRLDVGRESFAARLKRYLAVAGDLARGATVDLRFNGQVYVKEPEATTPGEDS